MEIIVIVTNVILIIVALIMIVKQMLLNKESKQKLNEELYKNKEKELELKQELYKLVNETNKETIDRIISFQNQFIATVSKEIRDLKDRMNTNLDSNFSKTETTFVNVAERLAKIDEAQKNISSLSKDILELNKILTDKKTRGIFGEIQLHQILTAVFGENKSLYEREKVLSNNKRVDAIVHAPKPLGSIAVDSKFPLENYKIMIEEKTDQAIRKFRQDVKKHIDDISSKYIVEFETSEQAMMFIPAEAIFSEIVSNHEELINYAFEKSVWIVSPTTLISTLTIIQTIVSNMEKEKNSELILEELKELSIEFSRYKDRWDRLIRSIDSTSKYANEVNITSNKINDKFDKINNR